LTLSGAGAAVVLCYGYPAWQLTDGRPKPAQAVYTVWEGAPDVPTPEEGFLAGPAARAAQVRQPIGPRLIGYQTARRFAVLTPLEGSTAFRCVLPAPDGDALGSYGPLTVRPDRPGYLLTQVIAFPWNHFFVDGVPVDPATLRTDGLSLAVPVPAGAHR